MYHLPKKNLPVGGNLHISTIDESTLSESDMQWYHVCKTFHQFGLVEAEGKPFFEDKRHPIFDILKDARINDIYMSDAFSDMQVIEIMIYLSMLCISTESDDDDDKRSTLLNLEGERIMELLERIRIPKDQLQTMIEKAKK